MRPKLLELFSCASGAGMGYHRAGFEVTAVDIEPQPNNPFTFIQADALELLRDRDFLGQFDAVHASPTCQRKARVTAWRGRREDHPNTLTPTLQLLRTSRIPWVVENVPEAAAQGRAPVRRRHGLHVDDGARGPAGDPAGVHRAHRPRSHRPPAGGHGMTPLDLAEAWEEWAAAASAVAAEMDDRSAAHLRALAEARVQDATALRNLLKDQETDMNAVIYSTPLADGQVVQRAGLKTATPGLVVDTPLFPCHDFGDPCWTVVHVRSGRPFPFHWESRGAALEMAERCAEFGPWQDDEDAAVQRMRDYRTAVTRLAYDLGGQLHDFPAPRPGGIDNGAVA